MVVFGKVVVFAQKWLYSFKSGCNRAKVFVFGQSGSIRAKIIVFVQSLCIRVKLVVFVKKLLYWSKVVAKVVVFGQSGCNPAKSGCILLKLP